MGSIILWSNHDIINCGLCTPRIEKLKIHCFHTRLSWSDEHYLPRFIFQGFFPIRVTHHPSAFRKLLITVYESFTTASFRNVHASIWCVYSLRLPTIRFRSYRYPRVPNDRTPFRWIIMTIRTFLGDGLSGRIKGPQHLLSKLDRTYRRKKNNKVGIVLEQQSVTHGLCKPRNWNDRPSFNLLQPSYRMHNMLQMEKSTDHTMQPSKNQGPEFN